MKVEIKKFLKEKKTEFINEDYTHVGGLEFKDKESGEIIDIDELEDIFSDFIGEIVGNL